ncbi:ABC transporter permease subunit [Paenibacillus antri]|uniref:ABC transporter permease subunit n=1 Tax=Paenibacillus antri TaxID=2582848 RepID=A0A5R9G7Q2_9BACL|nr:nickel/cobalt ABC transporter permease [Paenibacillus antri]TLS52442.1 ABC transporter permease subunit [Paenibacillus antri]
MALLRNVLRDRLASMSFSVLGAVMILGILAPVFAPHDPYEVHMELRYASASWEYWLGNDHLGRCILSRMIYGIRPSVLWVFAALVLSVGLGAALGFLAGYFKGTTDAVLMRICDVMLSFPGYVMTLALIGILGVGLENILIAFLILKWAWFTRIIRTSVMQHAEANYVTFAKIAGVSDAKIMLRHLVPVTLPDIAVIASSSFGTMVLQISGFSFLGLGIQAPNAEWGMMLNEARAVMFSKPEFMFVPGFAIIVVVCFTNFLSDALQVALDPKLMAAKRKPRGWFSVQVGKLERREGA